MLGCVAQQEGEKIFDRAPYVSLVSGSASYRKLPEMLSRLEAGESRITGLDDRQTDETFETEFTARRTLIAAYITIIEGCDKFCSYCVVPLYARKRAKPRFFLRARGGPPDCRQGISPRSSCWGKTSTATAIRKGSRASRNCWRAVGQVPGIRRVRFTTSHPRDFTRDIVDAIDAVPTLCDHVHLPVQSGSSQAC